MIRINKNHLNRFKYFSWNYHYMVKKGVWLAFDKDTLEYTGVLLMYMPSKYDNYNSESNALINKLIALDILEVVG